MQQIYLTAPVPVNGLNTDHESTEFSRAQSPWMQNVVCEPTMCRKRMGYSKLGNTSLPLSGTGMRLIFYVDATGYKHHIALTTTNAYRFSENTGEWDDITPYKDESDVDGWTASTAYSIGDYVKIVNGSTKFYVCIEGHTSGSTFSEDSDKWDQVDGVPDLFSGSTSNKWSVCTVTDFDAFRSNGGMAVVITNGVDGFFAFEGQTGDRFVKLDKTGGPLDGVPFSGVKSIQEFWNHFFVMNCVVSGTRNSRVLYYSDTGDISEWSLGVSGHYVLTDTVGQILRAVPLGTAMVVYSEGSITMCRYFGGITVFSFPTLIYETGLFAEGAVWSSTNVHFLLGTDRRVYAYFGETDLKPVGEGIEKRLFNDIDISKKHLINNGLDQGRHKALFAIPLPGDDYCQDIYAFNFKPDELSWERYRLNHSVQGFGLFENYLAWYCDSADFADVYCDETSQYCDAGYGQIGYSKTCFITADGYVYQFDEFLNNDDGEPIYFMLHTPDMTADREERFLRFQWFSFTAAGVTSESYVHIRYSTDSGDTWTKCGNVLLSREWKTYRVPIDVVGRRIRFSISQYKLIGDVRLRGTFKVKAVVQTERDVYDS